MRALALLVLALAALWFSPRAEAATYEDALANCNAFKAQASASPYNHNFSGCSDIGAHLSVDTSHGNCSGPSGGSVGYVCMTFQNDFAGQQAYADSYNIPTCPSGQQYSTASHQCENPCSTSAPPLTNITLAVQAGSATNPWENDSPFTCSDGCTYGGESGTQLHSTIDGQQYSTWPTMTPNGQACTAGGTGYNPPTNPPQDSDGDGVSDGNDGAPANPGSDGGGAGSSDHDGDGQPDGSDGTCGVAGKPPCDDSAKNSNKSTGGGDCKTPPVSSGDQILSQIAFQTWATRCALQDKANTGNGGGSGPVGGGTDMTATNGKLDGIKDALTNKDGGGDRSDGSAGHEGDRDGLWAGDGDGEGYNLDDGGFGLSRSCPAPPQISLLGMSATIDTEALCTAAGWFGLLIVLCAFVQAAWIIGGD